MALLHRLAPGGQPDEAEVEPLTPLAAARLRTSLFGRFSPGGLARQVEAEPELAWVVRGHTQYALGGHWRRRPEIGEVVEVARGPYRRLLLRRLLRAFVERGVGLVVLDFEESGNDAAFYWAAGFRPIERIVEYERRGSYVAEVPSEVPTRPFAPPDVEAVLDIEHESFPWLWWNSRAELEHYSQLPDVEIQLALAGERPIGYAGYTVRGAAGHLDRLAVRQGCQGQGVGGALLRLALARMAGRGVRRVTLTTQEDNHRSQALYERHDFRRGRWGYDIHGLWLREPGEVAP